MKKLFCMMLCLCLALCGSAACRAETVSVLGLEVPADTTVLDFDAAGVNVTDPDALLEALALLPRVTDVLMYDSTMAQEDMEKVFDARRDLFFGFTLHLAVHTIRTDVTAFSTLHMKNPTKDDPRHTSEELSILRMCKKLKALDIGHNTLTNLDFLWDLPDIEVLIISPNYGLTDISPVANLKNLVYLECFNTPITDISALAGLTKLRDLNLTRCNLVEDLSPLYDLPNLERFWWGVMSKVTNEQRKEMRARHPDCRFVAVSDPTEGGWRNHPHQKEQMAFFRSGEYVPFAE